MLAYHVDDEIRAVLLGVGLPLAALVVAYAVALAFRLREGAAGNPAAPRALTATLIALPVIVVAGELLGALILPAILPLGLVAYALKAVRRVPVGGHKAVALAAFGLSGLMATYVGAYAVACVVSDGCFH